MRRFLLSLLVLAPMLAHGQALKLDSLDKLAAKATNTVKVTLNGSMLRLAARFLSADEPEEAQIKDLVKQLKGVYVRSFEFSKSGEYSESDLEAIRSQLRDSAWTPIVEVHTKSDGDNADIFVREQGDHFIGIAIIASEPRELTVVNIDGVIDIEGLARLAGHFGIPDQIRLNVEKKRK